MNYTVVTSFSKKGFHEYGRRFIETFKQFWPPEVSLMIYHEGSDDPIVLRHHNVNLIKYVKNCYTFLGEYSDNPLFNGALVNQPLPWKKKCIMEGYNYRFDMIKFARKVFAIEDAASVNKTGKMFWVDADVLTFAKISIDFLDSLLPNNVALSFLNRPGSYSECGFVGYNLNHPACHPFISEFADVYKNGKVIDFAEWHDSYVFDKIRISKNIPGYGIPSPNRGHIFINSILGSVMDHLKGDRKKSGRSNDIDLTTMHEHKYWQRKV